MFGIPLFPTSNFLQVIFLSGRAFILTVAVRKLDVDINQMHNTKDTHASTEQHNLS